MVCIGYIKAGFIMNENGRHGFICLSSWLPGSVSVWEGLGCVALLDVCHKKWAPKPHKPAAGLVSLFCLLSVDQDVKYQLLLHAMPACFLP